jgi:hypothetical protein
MRFFFRPRRAEHALFRVGLRVKHVSARVACVSPSSGLASMRCVRTSLASLDAETQSHPKECPALVPWQIYRSDTGGNLAVRFLPQLKPRSTP